MNKKIIVNIKRIEEIVKYQEQGILNYLLPLAGFCVGYEEIKLEEIYKISTDYYLLINRILTKEDLNNLENILNNINKTNLKGIFFEDLGILEIINNLQIDCEKIYFPNHFGTNYASINAFFKRGIDSMVLSNEITIEEIKEILDKVTKEVVIQVYGYNQIMYSRRNLISNFNNEFNLKLPLDNEIVEKVTKKSLKIRENNYGTIVFDTNIYNNLELLKLTKNIKLYYINTTFMEVEDILDVLNNPNDIQNNSFLNKKTIYKIGDIDE